MAALTPNEIDLIDRWQRSFPLSPAPYAEIARELGLTEAAVLGLLRGLARRGILSRVGAAVRPNTAGASTLAAMRVPAASLERIAALVSAYPGVNHNYEREHAYNLWFVVTGVDRDAVARVLRCVHESTGLEVLDLPLERAYHIDLGFPMGGAGRERRVAVPPPRSPPPVSEADRRLLAALEEGLDLDRRPYLRLAERIGEEESSVITRLGRLAETGVVSRFGLIVRHRELGWTANAMAVWDVPATEVDRCAALLAVEPWVTLCYRRPRRPPDWPYNLFCMVHGRCRDEVRGQLRESAARAGLGGRAGVMLFSRRRFKQRGARLSAA